MQTARGASLNHTGDRRHRPLGLFFAVAVIAYVVDQVTKVWAVARLDGELPIVVVPHLFSLSFLRNPGAAFGMGDSITPVLTAFMIVIAAAVVVAALRVRHRGWALALGLLLGGALGNITDRLARAPGVFHGHVIDFLDYAGFFVGNVADIAITVAAVLLRVLSGRGIGRDGEVARR